MKRIVVRFDDLCPTMNYQQFEKAFSVMDKYNIKPLIGIVPDNQDSDLMIDKENNDFWKKMIKYQDNGYEIAMHGYTHVLKSKHRGMVNINYKSEFAGISYSEQFNMLRNGKKILEKNGINTDVFYAPCHSYDRDTLRALAYNGFKFMSDGKSNHPYVQNGIICIPCKSFRISTMQKRRNGIYMLVFHPSEWSTEQDFEEYQQIIEKNYKDIVSFSELKELPISNIFFAKMEEKIAVLYDRYIFPILYKVYLKIKGLKEK